MEYNQRIKEARLKFNMTQKQLADAAEVAPGSISAYEKGTKAPPVDVAYRIAKSLNVSLDWLFNSEMTEDDLKASARSYGDIARALVALATMQPKDVNLWAEKVPWHHAKFPFSQEEKDELENSNSEIYETELHIKGEIIGEFVSGFRTLYQLYTSNTIEKEMLDAWLQKKYSELEQIPLRST